MKWVLLYHVTGGVGEGGVGMQITCKPLHLLQVDKCTCSRVLGTGASVSLISQATQKSLYPGATLSKPKLRLRTYTQHPISVVGTMSVRMKYEEYEGRQTLHVVDRCGPSSGPYPGGVRGVHPNPPPPPR